MTVLVLAGPVPLFLLFAGVEIHVSGRILAAPAGHVDGRVVSQIHGARGTTVVVCCSTNRNVVGVSIGGYQAIGGVAVFARDIHVLFQEDFFTDTPSAAKNRVEHSSFFQESSPFSYFFLFDIVLPLLHHLLRGIQKKSIYH